MKRFRCFNTIMQNNSSTDDDKEEEENEPDGEENGDADKSASSEEKIEVVIPPAPIVDPEFADTGFWKQQSDDLDIDDLLADYE